jgi:hypothetical protein
MVRREPDDLDAGPAPGTTVDRDEGRGAGSTGRRDEHRIVEVPLAGSAPLSRSAPGATGG